MPITNLAIQRKRLDELRDFKEKYKEDVTEVRITRPENYCYFYVLSRKITPHHLHILKELKFNLCGIEAENEKVKLLVGKMSPEKPLFADVFGYIAWGGYIK